MTNKEIQEEALSRASNPFGTMSNFPTIFRGFIAKGILEIDIKPRENVFTFQAWKALGRHVRKGEHGVRIVTFRQEEEKVEKPDGTVELKFHSRPWSATVFHISQTEPDTIAIAS